MNDPRSSRALLTTALLFVLAPLVLLLGQRPGSAGFVVTVLTLVIGVLFTGLVCAVRGLAARQERADNSPSRGSQ